MDNLQKFYTVRGYEHLQQNKNLLTSAMEDYLEMIYRNSLKEGYMRINTLSELLNVRASSTTKMVQKLTALGMLNYQKYGIIFLTDKGRETGKFLLERHETIEVFLKFMAGSEDVLKETELIEHSITPDTLVKFNLLTAFFEKHPEIVKQYRDFEKSYVNEALNN